MKTGPLKEKGPVPLSSPLSFHGLLPSPFPFPPLGGRKRGKGLRYPLPLFKKLCYESNKKVGSPASPVEHSLPLEDVRSRPFR